MISVLTLTYQRHNLLEEAIESFLRQEAIAPFEMVIINDSDAVDYICKSPGVRVINLKDRFSSIGEKLFYGFSQCRNEYIYRLDDDDLLAPGGLSYVLQDINEHPGYDIYRANGHYFFEHNCFKGISGSVNNGNVYSKKYLSGISIPKSSFGEDFDITYRGNGRIYESTRQEKTMIYRWGMNTYHVSGMGQIDSTSALSQVDKIVTHGEKAKDELPDVGVITLHPHFDNDYYGQISP